MRRRFLFIFAERERERQGEKEKRLLRCIKRKIEIKKKNSFFFFAFLFCKYEKKEQMEILADARHQSIRDVLNRMWYSKLKTYTPPCA